MKKYTLLFALMMTIPALAEDAITIFTRDDSDIEALRNELKDIQNSGYQSYELNALLDESNKIAEMNHKCGTISLSDIQDPECSQFYTVDLPSFEEKYLKLTGEARLNAITVETELDKREKQIQACTDALRSIALPKDQFISLHGRFEVEPLPDNQFDVTYTYNMEWNEERIETIQENAALWLDKCKQIIFRQNSSELAPLFVSDLAKLNQSFKEEKRNVKIELTDDGDLFLSNQFVLKGVYKFNGSNLFFYNEKWTSPQKSILRIGLEKNSIESPAQDDRNYFNQINGRQKFSQRPKNGIVGTWSWIPSEDEAKESSYSIFASNNDVLYADNRIDPQTGSEIKMNYLGAVGTITVVVGIASMITGIVFNALAVSEKNDSEPTTREEYLDIHDKIQSKQNLRNMFYGIGAATTALGSVFIVLSF